MDQKITLGDFVLSLELSKEHMDSTLREFTDQYLREHQKDKDLNPITATHATFMISWEFFNNFGSL